MLGVAVFDAGWASLNRAPWLVPAQVLAIGLASALLYLLLISAGLRGWRHLLVLGLFVAISLAMRHGDSRFAYRLNAIVVTLAISLLLAVALALLRFRPGQALTAFEPEFLSGAKDDGHVPGLDGGRKTIDDAPSSSVVRRPSEQRGSYPQHLQALGHWPAFAGYLAATSLMLWPLLARFTTYIIGPPGDNYEYLWKMQWFSDALLGQHVSPVFTPQIYYPAGPELTISEITPAHTLLALPITRLFGPIVSYNLVIVASFVLTGFFTYLLAVRLGARRGAAWVAGLIFAFCLRRFFHSTGHLGMMGTQWLALTLYGWEGLLTRRRMWDAYLTGVAFALITWSSWLYGTTFPVLLILYALVRLGLRGLPRLWSAWPALLLAAAIVVALVLPLAQPYYEAKLQGETYQHQYAQVLANSVWPLEYLWPNPYHPLWGGWASQLYPADGERGANPGYVAITLGVVALWLGRKQRIVQALAVVAGISVIMSFGPELRLPNGASLPLPAQFIYYHAPVIGNIRTWGRMAIYVALVAALLASLALTAAPRRWYRAAWVLAAGLALFEMLSIVPISAPHPRPVDLWLGRQPGAGAVAEVPNGIGAVSVYYTLFTGKPTILGQGIFAPSLWRESRDLLYDFPKESAIRLLQRWGTDYIIVDAAAMARERSDWQARAASNPLLAEVYRDDGYSVYQLKR
jgi:hypothetical protein